MTIKAGDPYTSFQCPELPLQSQDPLPFRANGKDNAVNQDKGCDACRTFEKNVALFKADDKDEYN